MVNSSLVDDPTIRQVGFNFPWQQRSLLSRFRTAQGHCGACKKKWNQTATDLCPTLSTLVFWQSSMAACLNYTGDEAVAWLTSYLPWCTCKKKISWPEVVTKSRFCKVTFGAVCCLWPVMCAEYFTFFVCSVTQYSFLNVGTSAVNCSEIHSQKWLGRLCFEWDVKLRQLVSDIETKHVVYMSVTWYDRLWRMPGNVSTCCLQGLPIGAISLVISK